MFAGFCVGVILLVICLEFLRRMDREFDAFILRRAHLRQMYLPGLSDSSGSFDSDASTTPKIKLDNVILRSDGKMKSDDYDTSDDPHHEDLITAIPDLGSNMRALDPACGRAATPDGTNKSGETTARRQAFDLPRVESYRPSPFEQVVRALVHTLQFAVAYLLMLLAMYFNGYIIICIFIGAFLGSLVFSWEPLTMKKE